MNRLLLILMLFHMGLTAIANEPDKDSSKEHPMGIVFHEGNWAKALEQAKAENKPIFLDVYASWCGPCKRLKKNTFADKEVGDFYNNAFINVAVDGEKGEGILLARTYGVTAYPSLFFIDHTGKLISYTKGYHNAAQFLRLGQAALQKK
jgi:thioredoxin 1